MKNTVNIIFSTCFIFLISIGSVFAIGAGTDPIFNVEDLEQIKTGGNFFLDNWGTIAAVVGILITILLRLIPSLKNYDLLTLVVQIIDAILPNKAKIEDREKGFLKGVFKYRKEKK